MYRRTVLRCAPTGWSRWCCCCASTAGCPPTALAGELEVSTRTVLRDIEALSAAGVPVYAERGRHGGFALLPGFRTELTGLSHDESLALLVAGSRRGAQSFGLGSALASAMLKVVDALPESHRATAAGSAERLLVDPRTDLLARPLVGRRGAGRRRGRGAACGVRRSQAAHAVRGGRARSRAGGRWTRSVWSRCGARGTCWPRGPARTAPTGWTGSWPPSSSPSLPSGPTASTWTACGRSAARGSGPAASWSRCWSGWTRRGGSSWWAPRWPSTPTGPDPRRRLAGAGGHVPGRPARRVGAVAARRGRRGARAAVAAHRPDRPRGRRGRAVLAASATGTVRRRSLRA